MSEKYLAFIWHAEDYINKEECLCYIQFLTGKLRGKIVQAKLTTGIFKYYYWGVTLEEVELNARNEVIGVADLTVDSLSRYNMNILHALTFNEETSDVLGSDGFVYKLNQSVFYNRCKAVYDYIVQEMKTANNCILRLYIKDGGIFSILFDKNISPKSPGYKYIMQRGFVTADKKVLRTMIPSTDASVGNSNDKLSQSDVDKMFEELLSKNNTWGQG